MKAVVAVILALCFVVAAVSAVEEAKKDLKGSEAVYYAAPYAAYGYAAYPYAAYAAYPAYHYYYR